MKTYGYCRISRKTQSIDRQIRNILDAYPGAIIVQEAYTGTKIDRKEWNKLYKAVKAGDTIVFDSVSRMSRNADEGYKAYQELNDRGVNLVFLKEPQINTDTYKAALTRYIPKTGTKVDLILDGINAFLEELAKEQIYLSFGQAEKEVTDLHRRTSEGIESARLNGKQIGQTQGAKLSTKKSKAAKDIILKHSKDFGGTLADKDVITLAGISPNSYYKYKRELKSEQ